MILTRNPYAWPATLPLFAHMPIAHMDVENATYLISLGFSEAVAHDVVTHASDMHDRPLQEFTNDVVRFSSLSAYTTWYEKGRVPFALCEEKTSTLAACIWFGVKEPPLLPPENHGCIGHSVAFRSYSPYRGKGLMKPFARFVLEEYQKHNTSDTYLWLSTSENNVAALGLYDALGFEEYGRKDGKVLMMMKK